MLTSGSQFEGCALGEKKKTQIFSTDAKRLVLPPTLVWRLGRLKSKERRRAGNYALHLFNKLEPRLRVQETTQSRGSLAPPPSLVTHSEMASKNKFPRFSCQFHVHDVGRVRLAG